MKYKKLIINSPKILILFVLLIPVFIIDGWISIFAMVIMWPFDKLRTMLTNALTKLINTIQ